MALWKPTNAGPDNIRSLYHWVHKQLVDVGALVGDEGGGPGEPPGHVHDHDNLINVTPDQHHNQVHALYGGDHSDVSTATPLEMQHLLHWNGSAFSPDYRVKAKAYSNGATYYPQDMVLHDAYLME